MSEILQFLASMGLYLERTTERIQFAAHVSIAYSGLSNKRTESIKRTG